MKRKLATSLSVAVLFAVPTFLQLSHAEWKGPEAKALFSNEAKPKGYNYAPSVITENRGGSGKLHSGAEWNFCLTAARMAADQER